MAKSRPSIAETFGLTEPLTRIEQVKLALRGDEYTPPSQWGFTSVLIFRPRLSVKTWAGWKPADRLVPVTNYFNRTQTPIQNGWSVKKTQVLDWKGGTNTYDSHNGTDFAIPVGTPVVTPAAGLVLRVSSEFHRGGLKIIIDHGHGLITTSGHLARSFVRAGDQVSRGDVIALSGYSGLDAVVAFPWSVPHVHFNTWLNGVPVDPFAMDGEESLWLEHNNPKPPLLSSCEPAEFETTEWDEDALAALIDSCIDPVLKATLRASRDVDLRAGDTIFMKNYFPTRFSADISPYAKTSQRQPLLDLLFAPEDYDGVRLL